MKIPQTKDPHDWSIEEVVRHIREHDQALAPHAKQFQDQVGVTRVSSVTSCFSGLEHKRSSFAGAHVATVVQL